jgi:hypothetical protein
MNVADGLKVVRERLEEQGANPKTLQYVDLFIKRASSAGAAGAAAQSLAQLVRMLMRTPGAVDNTVIYNDLARLEETMLGASAEYQARKAAEDAKPLPKTKKYYKDLKDKEKKTT